METARRRCGELSFQLIIHIKFIFRLGQNSVATKKYVGVDFLTGGRQREEPPGPTPLGGIQSASNREEDHEADPEYAVGDYVSHLARGFFFLHCDRSRFHPFIFHEWISKGQRELGL